MKRAWYLLLLFPFSSIGYAAQAASFTEALSDGNASLIFRARHEFVDQSGAAKEANASTLKTRVNYRSADYKAFSFFIEIDDVTYLADENFNNTNNGRAYPTVADPDGTDINQLFATFKLDAVTAKIGRQRINLDNQRFLGGVGWRQNEQTYDGLSLLFDGDKADFTYAYVSNVSRIFGPKSATAPGPADSFESEMHLLNAKLQLAMPGSLSLYAYAMDLEDAPALSNRTLGIRYSGTLAESFPVQLEFATQDDHGNNATAYSANYLLAEIGYKFEESTIKLGYEVLEGDTLPGKAFRTPLATGHKFHGWADKFLATPTGGLEDVYISFGQKFGANTIGITWHDFDSETGSVSYGSEVDASWAHKISDQYSLLFKAALYDADSVATDTTKVWVMFTASF